MTVSRGPLPERDYTIVLNTWLRDRALSLKAKGLLAYIVSHTESYALTVEQMINDTKEGRVAVQAALRELQEHRYLRRTAIRRQGRIERYDYQITDPADGFTGDGEPARRNTARRKPATSDDQGERDVSTGEAARRKPARSESAPKKTTPPEDQKKTTSGADAGAPPSASKLLGDWLDWLRAKGIETLPGQTRARYGKELKAALADGFSVPTIGKALKLLYDRGKASNPQLLPHLLIEVQSTEPVSGPPQQPTFRERDEANARRKREQRAVVLDLAQKLIDAGVPPREALKQAEAEVEVRAKAANAVETNTGVPYIVDGDVVRSTTHEEVTGS